MPSELSLAASDRSPYLPDDAGGLSGQEDALALGREGAGRRGGPSVRPRQCSTVRILRRMTTPVPTRFSDDELALIDELVDEGVGESRSAVIRQGVHHLADAVRRASVGAAIATSYRDVPQSSEDDDLAMASAIAITEAEPW